MARLRIAALLAVALAAAAPLCAEPPDPNLPYANLKNARIAIVRFLPANSPENSRPHERVFTGEFYSLRPADRKLFGWFVPKEALDLIERNLRVVAEMHGLKVDVVQNAADAADGYDYVVLGALREFNYGKEASIKMTVRLLDGRTLEPLADHKIERVARDEKASPLYVNQPLHMVGAHLQDLRPQRMVLNYSAYECALELLGWVAEKARP